MLICLLKALTQRLTQQKVLNEGQLLRTVTITQHTSNLWKSHFLQTEHVRKNWAKRPLFLG